MGSHVMREAPGVDFYVEWSSVVEAPTAYGDRAWMLAYLTRDADKWLREDAPHHPENRLKRADETGTSSLWVTVNGMRDRYPEEGAWDDTPTVYKQQGLLSRGNIFTLAHRLMEDGGADASDLLTPFEDDQVIS